MTSRLIQARTAISEKLFFKSERVENLASVEWKLMARIVTVLEPIEQATTGLSGATYSTLSHVMLLLQCFEATLKGSSSGRND